MAPRQWTRDDDKRFETLLVQYPENYPNRFETIADNLQIPLDEVIYHYDALVYDIDLIESGQVDIDYPETSSFQSKHKKKRPIPWSEDEHRLFLEGLEKFGKGDWKSISREFVWTRTPTQVASHAQKFYMRQNLDNKSKKRSSIHDTTSVNSDNVTSPGSIHDTTSVNSDNVTTPGSNSDSSRSTDPSRVFPYSL